MCAASRDASFEWGSMCAAGDSPDFQEIPVWSVDFQEDSKEVALCSIIALCAAKKKLLEENKARKEWCKPWLSRRPLRGSYSQIFSELELENPSDFENYTRMPITAFHDILKRIHPYIVKEDTRLRESISPGARLEATLRFLASGGSYASLQYSSRISKQSLSRIIPETCEAIYNVLKEEYLKVRLNGVY